MAAPWISVITVVKDDPEGFARTLDSLVRQDLNGVEFVVVDSSRDRSTIPDLVADVPCVYAWTEPRGIYAAMNAALARASGDMACFANAGDTFAADDVLNRVRPLVEGKVWAHGPVEVVDVAGNVVVTPPWDYDREKAVGFSRGHFPAHQGTFTNREELLSLGGFDTTYEIAADYAMALRLSQVADPVVLDFPIARFHEGGASTQRWQDSFREFHRARRSILKPRGMDALRERWFGGVHFVSVWLHRTVISPYRGRRS